MGFFATLRADQARYRALCQGAADPGRVQDDTTSSTEKRAHPNFIKGRLLPMFVHPKLIPLTLIRLAFSLQKHRLGSLGLIVSQLNLLIFKIEVPQRAEIGPGLSLPHPFGIVLGSARIGENVTIFQNVTLGARYFEGKYSLSTRPKIEDGVTIGVGAVVIGPVTVGEKATVAPNSTVTRDVPPGATAIGVPAVAKTPANTA